VRKIAENFKCCWIQVNCIKKKQKCNFGRLQEKQESWDEEEERFKGLLLIMKWNKCMMSLLIQIINGSFHGYLPLQNLNLDETPFNGHLLKRPTYCWLQGGRLRQVVLYSTLKETSVLFSKKSNHISPVKPIFFQILWNFLLLMSWNVTYLQVGTILGFNALNLHLED
jgi:hypothetical protein